MSTTNKIQQDQTDEEWLEDYGLQLFNLYSLHVNVQKHFTDAHTWLRCEVKAMADWVLIDTLVVV